MDTAEARGAIAGLLARLDLAPRAAGPANPAAGPEGSAPGPGSAAAALPELAGALGHAAECIAERLRASAAADKSDGAAMNGVSSISMHVSLVNRGGMHLQEADHTARSGT